MSNNSKKLNQFEQRADLAYDEMAKLIKRPYLRHAVALRDFVENGLGHDANVFFAVNVLLGHHLYAMVFHNGIPVENKQDHIKTQNIGTSGGLGLQGRGMKTVAPLGDLKEPTTIFISKLSDSGKWSAVRHQIQETSKGILINPKVDVTEEILSELQEIIHPDVWDGFTNAYMLKVDIREYRKNGDGPITRESMSALTQIMGPRLDLDKIKFHYIAPVFHKDDPKHYTLLYPTAGEQTVSSYNRIANEKTVRKFLPEQKYFEFFGADYYKFSLENVPIIIDKNFEEDPIYVGADIEFFHLPLVKDKNNSTEWWNSHAQVYCNQGPPPEHLTFTAENLYPFDEEHQGRFKSPMFTQKYISHFLAPLGIHISSDAKYTDQHPHLKFPEVDDGGPQKYTVHPQTYIRITLKEYSGKENPSRYLPKHGSFWWATNNDAVKKVNDALFNALLEQHPKDVEKMKKDFEKFYPKQIEGNFLSFPSDEDKKIGNDFLILRKYDDKTKKTIPGQFTKWPPDSETLVCAYKNSNGEQIMEPLELKSDQGKELILTSIPGVFWWKIVKRQIRDKSLGWIPASKEEYEKAYAEGRSVLPTHSAHVLVNSEHRKIRGGIDLPKNEKKIHSKGNPENFKRLKDANDGVRETTPYIETDSILFQAKSGLDWYLNKNNEIIYTLANTENHKTQKLANRARDILGQIRDSTPAIEQTVKKVGDKDISDIPDIERYGDLVTLAANFYAKGVLDSPDVKKLVETLKEESNK